jgi:hypothetical protein
MNWTDQPATWKQLRYLKRVGHKPDRALTKTEASELIAKLGGPAEKLASVAEPHAHETSKHDAYELRLQVEEAKQRVAEAEPFGRANAELNLALTVSKRQRFWVDTCCNPTQMQAASGQVVDFYRRFGCRFDTPTSRVVQEILDALDSAMPTWERDHPALFYQTLEMNFSHLLRRG